MTPTQSLEALERILANTGVVGIIDRGGVQECEGLVAIGLERTKQEVKRSLLLRFTHPTPGFSLGDSKRRKPILVPRGKCASKSGWSSGPCRGRWQQALRLAVFCTVSNSAAGKS
jgi:hypothetical protein